MLAHYYVYHRRTLCFFPRPSSAAGPGLDRPLLRFIQVNILTRKLANYRNLGWPAAWHLEEELKSAEQGIGVRGSIGEATYVTGMCRARSVGCGLRLSTTAAVSTSTSATAFVTASTSATGAASTSADDAYLSIAFCSVELIR